MKSSQDKLKEFRSKKEQAEAIAVYLDACREHLRSTQSGNQHFCNELIRMHELFVGAVAIYEDLKSSAPLLVADENFDVIEGHISDLASSMRATAGRAASESRRPWEQRINPDLN